MNFQGKTSITPPHSPMHAKGTLSPGFSPMCNGNKLQELMTELCVQEGTQAAVSPINCPKSPKTKRARFTRTNSNDELKRSSSLSSFSTALAAIQAPEVESPESPAESNASTNNNVGKVKKQVRFSEYSSMGLFRPPADAHEMYWSKADKAKFKLDAVNMAVHIRATLQMQSSNAATASSIKLQPRAGVSSDILTLLTALETGHSIDAEELIGLEELIQGFEHARNVDAQRKKIVGIVVRAWRHLKKEEIKKRQLQQQQGLSVTAGSEADDAINRALSLLYKKISRKSLLKARCHAAYVHGMNRGVDSSAYQASTGQSCEKRRTRLCRRAAHAA